MLRCCKLSLCLLGLAALSLPLMTAASVGAQTKPVTKPEAKADPVRIGMVDTLFTDVPPFQRSIGQAMFAQLMKQMTGMEGKMFVAGEAMGTAQKLSDGQLDLAVFHGVEFAWAQHRHPDLKPLMVAITRHQHAQAVVVVRKQAPFMGFAHLRSRIFALPLGSREHCRLFLRRNCRVCGQCDPHDYFKQVAKLSVEGSLDAVFEDRAQAVVVDRVSLENYAALKPGRHAQLRVLAQSELFPSGVIAYKEGALPAGVLRKFREGLLKAHEDPIGRDLLQMFGITSFMMMPDDYAQNLAEIMKAYPAPR